MWATIYAPGDTIAFNNTDISRFYVRSVYGSEGVDLASVANIAKSNLSISPNPFNTQTEVKFNLLSSAEIELKILNIKGEVVSTLYSGFAPAGQRSVVWNAAELSSGIYFVSLNLQGNNYIQKVVLVK
jgi:hypothetical protein